MALVAGVDVLNGRVRIDGNAERIVAAVDDPVHWHGNFRHRRHAVTRLTPAFDARRLAAGQLRKEVIL